MKKEQFLVIMQRRVATVAVGPSTARNMGPKGTIEAARIFLAQNVSLKEVGASGMAFPTVLNDLTRQLKRALPKGARNWGAARKFLNIFLRDANYNYLLRRTYRLGRIEKLLEVPVDSQVAKALIENSSKNESKGLPRWKAVISLKESENRKYQSVATALAKRKGICRVDLDLLFWRSES